MLESKINDLKKGLEIKKMEGEMFAEQVRSSLSPYIEFEECDVAKAEIAMAKVVELFAEIKMLKAEVQKLEKKL